MATKSFLKTRPGQRIDQPDFDHVADRTPRDVIEQLGESFLTGADTNRQYILSGFATSVVSPTITVTGGTAILSYRDRGELRYGSLMTDGATSRSIDIGSFPDATYFVYVALTLEEGATENRAFWDTTLTPDAETTRTVSTKRTENWTIAVETASPGPEWMLVASVVKSSGVVGAPTDLRQFYFEGSPASSPAFSVPDAEWGSANDRNADRATHGVKSLRKFVRAVQRQLSSIIGSNGWWSAVPTGADLTTLLSSKLARDGSQTMQGNLLPDGNSTRNLGGAAAYWQNFYATNIFTSLITAGNRFRASGSNLAVSGGGRAAMLDGTMSGTSPNNEHRIVYQNENSLLTGTAGPTIEIAINAEWFYDFVPTVGNYWRSFDAAQPSFLYSFGRDGLRIYQKTATAARWSDAAWGLLYTASSTNFVSALPTTINGTLFVGGATTVNGSVAAYSHTMSARAAAPVLHGIYANSIVHARGTIDFSLPANPRLAGSIDSHFNVNSTTTVSASDATVDFVTSFATGNDYQVIITPQAANQVAYVTAKTLSSFTFRMTDLANTQLVLTSLTSKVDFVVIGG